MIHHRNTYQENHRAHNHGRTAQVHTHGAIDRFFHPRIVKYLWAVIAASVIGFIGNEAVAQFRIKVGNEIGSASLVADGHHARVDGFTSLSVLFGAVGVWLGHRLHAELNVAVSPELSVERGHEIAKEVRHNLLHKLRYLSNATIHVDPIDASGEDYHRIAEHEHDDLPAHSH